MFKIGLENRDFCKSLHFYIVDAGKKKKKKKKTSCICWLVQLLSALRAEDIALRAMLSLFVFLVLRGACQRPDSGRPDSSAALGRRVMPSLFFSCAAGRLPAP